MKSAATSRRARSASQPTTDDQHAGTSPEVSIAPDAVADRPARQTERADLRGDRSGASSGGAARRRGPLVRRMLVIADVSGLVLAFAASIVVFRHRIGPDDPIELRHEILLFALTLPGWVLLAHLHGLYDRDEERASHSTRDELVGVFHLITVGAFLSLAGAWVTGLARPYPPKLFTFWVLAITLVALARVGARAFARTRPAYVQNAVILGADRSGELVAQKILDHPEYGVNVIGFVDVSSRTDVNHRSQLSVIGGPDDLRQIVAQHQVQRVIVGFFDHPVEEAIALVHRVNDLDVQVDIVPRLFEALDPSAKLHTVEGLPLIGLPPARYSRSALLVKRTADIALAGIGLILLTPLLAWIVLRISRGSPGPIFYRHERIGLGGRPFRLVKFRTMYATPATAPEPGGASATALERLLEDDPAARNEFARTQKLVDDPRVTPYGRFLRRTSLDELPQLVNVLRGEMSLVGPRPVTAGELARYGDNVDVLLSVRPGVTGYWQVNGRSRTDYEERVRLDIAYVRGWSLKLDLAILGKTAWTLIQGRDAY